MDEGRESTTRLLPRLKVIFSTLWRPPYWSGKNAPSESMTLLYFTPGNFFFEVVIKPIRSFAGHRMQPYIFYAHLSWYSQSRIFSEI
jgi:hypothetical protein